MYSNQLTVNFSNDFMIFKMDFLVFLFLFLVTFNYTCNCLLFIQDPTDDLNQCGVPWDDVNAIAEVAIIRKCQEDFAAGYPSFCGFRLYFELLWDYITGTGQLDDEISQLANQLWNSLMFPTSSTELTVRKVFETLFGDKILPTVNPDN